MGWALHRASVAGQLQYSQGREDKAGRICFPSWRFVLQGGKPSQTHQNIFDNFKSIAESCVSWSSYPYLFSEDLYMAAWSLQRALVDETLSILKISPCPLSFSSGSTLGPEHGSSVPSVSYKQGKSRDSLHGLLVKSLVYSFRFLSLQSRQLWAPCVCFVI